MSVVAIPPPSGRQRRCPAPRANAVPASALLLPLLLFAGCPVPAPQSPVSISVAPAVLAALKAKRSSKPIAGDRNKGCLIFRRTQVIGARLPQPLSDPTHTE